MASKIRTVLHIFDIFHYFLQLIIRLTPLTSAAKINKKLVNQKLCKTVLILDALYHNFDLTIFFISESEHYTIVSVISPAFHQSPKTESINIEQASNFCQSCMAKVSKQLAKFGNAGHSCLIFILSGLLIQLPFGLILHYGFFGFYIKSTTTTMMLYSIISYPVGIVLYLFCSFLYFWVSYKTFATIFSIKNG